MLGFVEWDAVQLLLQGPPSAAALVAAVRAVGAAVALPVGRDAVATRAPEVTPAPLAAAGARQLVAAVAAVDDAVALPRQLRGDTCVQRPPSSQSPCFVMTVG